MEYLVSAAIGYLLGCSNMAYYLGKRHHVNLRGGGSGNLGASNVTVLMGWKAGVLTTIHDIGKAMLAIWLAQTLLDGPHMGAVAGMAAVLGHIFPFYLGFRGGKGFASYIGAIVMLDWKFGLAIVFLILVVTLLSDYIVAGTTLTVVASPIYFGITSGSWLVAAAFCVTTGVILWKHRENYVRIFKGTELGLRSAIRGDNRVKK